MMMTMETPCIVCRRVGLVRQERIIRGTSSAVECYCAACSHTWWVEDGVTSAPVRSVQDFTFGELTRYDPKERQ